MPVDKTTKKSEKRSRSKHVTDQTNGYQNKQSNTSLNDNQYSMNAGQTTEAGANESSQVVTKRSKVHKQPTSTSVAPPSDTEVVKSPNTRGSPTNLADSDSSPKQEFMVKKS